MQFPPLFNSCQCRRGFRNRIWSQLEICLVRFIALGEALVQTACPARNGYVTYTYGTLFSHFLVLYKLFYLFYFFLLTLSMKVLYMQLAIFMLLVILQLACVLVDGYLLCLSLLLYFIGPSFFRSLLRCKPDFLSSFLSPFSCFFYGSFTNFTVAGECFK